MAEDQKGFKFGAAFWITSSIVALLLIAAGWIYYQYNEAMKYCYKITKFKIVKFTKDRLILDFIILIKNISKLGTKVYGYSFDIYLNKKLVGNAKSDKEFQFKANGITELPLSVDINPSSGFNPEQILRLIALAATDQSKIQFEFKGHIIVPFLRFKIKFPITIPYTLKELLEDDPNSESCTF